VRVPVPVVILLVLIVVSGIWWGSTRHLDFMTPPSEATLAKIRVEIESALPKQNEIDAAISLPIFEPPPPPPPPVEPPKPPIDLGDLATPPALHDYGNVSNKGADYLIELATALEKKGEFQRCLLAWERVLDLTKPSEIQATLAISSIQRLRPTLPDWNTRPETAIQVTLHVGTGKKRAKTLTPILEEIARTLEISSSGIIKVKAIVSAGKTNTAANSPTLVALWLAGPDKKSPSTEVLSFTVESPEAIRSEILKTVYLVVRSHLSRTTAYRLPNPLKNGDDPQQALDSHVTRLCWSAFATSLNPPAP
jgi:hypothetical protein